MAWFKVTEPEGQPVWLQQEHCVRVRLPAGGVHKAANAVIDLSNGEFQAVKETMEIVMKVLRK